MPAVALKAECEEKICFTGGVVFSLRCMPRRHRFSFEPPENTFAYSRYVPVGDGVSATKRRLPHWTLPDTEITYWVTFRLADSLPAGVLVRWRSERDAWLRENPLPHSPQQEHEYNERFSAKLDDYLDAGSGSCALRQPEIRAFVESALLRFDGVRHDVGAFVIMPNHVHLLTCPHPGNSLSEILAGVKGASARAANAFLGKTGEPFWQVESYDHIVRDQAEFYAFWVYLRNNPRRARLRSCEYTLYRAT
jgi:hypothetical protein